HVEIHGGAVDGLIDTEAPEVHVEILDVILLRWAVSHPPRRRKRIALDAPPFPEQGRVPEPEEVLLDTALEVVGARIHERERIRIARPWPDEENARAGHTIYLAGSAAHK